MGKGIDDTILGNGKEWESPCMGMGVGMALIPMGIHKFPADAVFSLLFLHSSMQMTVLFLLSDDDFW